MQPPLANELASEPEEARTLAIAQVERGAGIANFVFLEV
jgi:hypothetical protein